MADGSKIEWTDATWNVITGCRVVSPGCTNCYAMRLAGTRLKDHPSRAALTKESKAGPVWNGNVSFNGPWLDQPLRWKRPRRIFVCAHGDLFYEQVPFAWIDEVFAVMALAEHHVFQVLTKRPERMATCLADEGLARSDGRGEAVTRLARQHHPDPDALCLEGFRWPLKNVWLGFSAEDQPRFDERWRHMRRLAWAGWNTWVSLEPLLGSVDITAALWNVRPCNNCPSPDPDLDGIDPECCRDPDLADGLKWVVAGGESGPGARPAHPDWFRTIRDDCVKAEVPFLFKQWGEWLPGEAAQPPMIRFQDGTEIDRHLLPSNLIDDPPGWESGLFYLDGVQSHAIFRRVGKKAAGASLDGREWREFPA